MEQWREHMNRVIAALMIAALVPVSAAFAADASNGARIAAAKCAACHGATGAGDGVMLATLGVPVPPVPWTDKAKMAPFSDQQLTDVITNGGAAALKASPMMPAFGNQLSAAQIADLVAYIRSLGK
jgi:mono/diheme cytochrome c family protein